MEQINAFLETLGINKHPGLKINYNGCGYNDYTFGCKAGPVVPNVEDLAHELAHAIQFKAKNFHHRAKYGEFRFKENRKFLMGHSWSEQSTNQCTERELETFAIQAHLLRLGDYQFDTDEFFVKSANLTKYLPDFVMNPGENDGEIIALCSIRVKQYYESVNPSEIVPELIRWLDKTAKKLTTVEFL
jgi:hypothetical protein